MIRTGKARIAAIIGWPVAHSRSPALHGYWLDKYGIDGAMVPLAVAPGDLELVLRALPRMGMVGGNLTLPHKEAALTLVDEADETARVIGAINTLVVGKGGRLLGSNTDGGGFIAHVKASVPDWRPQAGPATVLGAGGAARAIAYALAGAGVPRLVLVNRTRERAAALASALSAASKAQIEAVAWRDRAEAIAGAALLVNTTSLGMSGQPPLDIALDRLGRDAVVADIVYSPLETDLLRRATARGHKTVDGLGMLIHQARPGFAAWFGREPEVTGELVAHLTGALEGECG